MKSSVTCMLMVNEHLWVGHHDGVKVFNTITKQPIGIWCTNTIITTMILVPGDHNNESLIMLTNSYTILIFTKLQWNSQRLLEDITPDHDVKLDCELCCALLVPTSNQLWVCTANSQLAVFSPGCYDHHEKYAMPETAKPCCMATVNDYVLVAIEAKIQKWSSGEIPTSISSLDCEATIMDKTTIHCAGKLLVGIN